MDIVTTAQMKAIEADAIEKKGVPSLLLMENAAYGVKKEVLKFSPKSVIVFAGKGNNGGDGLAVSRQLMAMGINVKIYFVGDFNKATPDCTLSKLLQLSNIEAAILVTPFGIVILFKLLQPTNAASDI